MRAGARVARSLWEFCPGASALEAVPYNISRGGRAQRSALSYCSQASPSSSATTAKKPPPATVTYGSLALALLTGGGLVTYYNREREKKLTAAQKSLSPVSVGKAAIGGPFSLVDGDNKPFTDKDLRGEFSMLYFGFTHCPDICPAELEKVAQAVDMIEKLSGRKVRPVFITLDPKRDGAEQVKEYCAEFHPRLLGLTGTQEQIAGVTKAYRVYFTRATMDDDDDEDEEEDQYLIDHSIITYMLDPEGEFLKFFGKNYTANDMALEASRLMAQWQKQ